LIEKRFIFFSFSGKRRLRKLLPRLRAIFLKESVKDTDGENGDIGRLQGLHGLAGNRNGVTMEDILKVLCCT